MFHINEKGEVGICRAKTGNCPFGGIDDHYPSENVARAVYEMSMSDYLISPHLRNSRFSSIADFLSEANRSDAEPLIECHDLALENPTLGTKIARFGVEPWEDYSLQIPHQADEVWSKYAPEPVAVSEALIRSPQEFIRYGVVRHYLNSPDEPFEVYTAEEGIAVKAVHMNDGSICIQEGNHRVAAAILAKRKISMILMPEKDIRGYSSK